MGLEKAHEMKQRESTSFKSLGCLNSKSFSSSSILDGNNFGFAQSYYRNTSINGLTGEEQRSKIHEHHETLSEGIKRLEGNIQTEGEVSIALRNMEQEISKEIVKMEVK